MKIIDIHTHIYPDKIARKATDSVKEFYNIGGSNMDGTVEMLLKRGAEAGISRYVVLPVSNTPNRVRSINDFIVEQVKEHDCFIGFPSMICGFSRSTTPFRGKSRCCCIWVTSAIIIHIPCGFAGFWITSPDFRWLRPTLAAIPCITPPGSCFGTRTAFLIFPAP